MVIGFCGHASYNATRHDEEKILQIIDEVAKNRQVDFYLGGYGDFDNFAKMCAQKYKQKHPDSKLIFITPYLGEWIEKRRKYLEEEYDEIVYPPLEKVPYKFAISVRNKYIIDNADVVIAYVKVDFGGAYSALKYAERRNKIIFKIE